MAASTLRALVVDDTALFRKILTDILKVIPGVEVVGAARNGREALEKITALHPDLVTLDIEMPEMNGLEALEALHASGRRDVNIVMVSSLTVRGGEMTIRALEMGAFDFIAKPQEGALADNVEAIRNSLVPIVQTLARRKETLSILRPLQGMTSKEPMDRASRLTPPSAVSPPLPERAGKSRIVAIGVSTGGPNALAVLMPALPADLPVPVLIVQHMPPVFTASLARSLDAKCAFRVKEAENGEPIAPGKALIAPGGRQMKVEAGPDGKTRIVRLTDDPPVNNCRPSVDYLFTSVARHYVGRATGVIMTGMGSDGFEGLKMMKQNGGFVIAQDESSCVVYGMPRAPIESGLADVVAPLENLAQQIIKTVR